MSKLSDFPSGKRHAGAGAAEGRLARREGRHRPLAAALGGGGGGGGRRGRAGAAAPNFPPEPEFGLPGAVCAEQRPPSPGRRGSPRSPPNFKGKKKY